jgi:hypothetical protein
MRTKSPPIAHRYHELEQDVLRRLAERVITDPDADPEHVRVATERLARQAEVSLADMVRGAPVPITQALHRAMQAAELWHRGCPNAAELGITEVIEIWWSNRPEIVKARDLLGVRRSPSAAVVEPNTGDRRPDPEQEPSA